MKNDVKGYQQFNAVCPICNKKLKREYINCPKCGTKLSTVAP